MKPAPFAYHRARSVEHALDLLAAYAPEGGRVLAGGQSLVPLMALRLAQPPHLIDINRLPLGECRLEAGHLCIPATTRHTALAAAPVLGPALAAVAEHVAHLPIRSRGTFCGSLAHADPSAEWPLVFATLGGEAVARSSARERRIDAAGFTRDIMTTALEPDELLTEIRLALPPRGARLGFHEVSRRAGDYAMAMAFAVLSIEDGTISHARLGIGGAEPRPRRIAAAEAILLGAAPTADTFATAASAAAEAVDPMEEPQIPVSLRRNLVRTVARQALAIAGRAPSPACDREPG